MARIRRFLALLVLVGVVATALSARRGIGIQVQTDGTLFARGMTDEVNITLLNRDNRQHKIVAQLVAVRPGLLVAPDYLGSSATGAATLNSGDHRLMSLSLDTSELQAGERYKVGILIYRNLNSTEFPMKGSLLAVAHVADITICDPLEIVNANASLCNQIGIRDIMSDATTP